MFLTDSMVMLLGILVGAVLYGDGVSLQRVLGLDADEEGASTSGGNTLAREEGGLEAAGESALQLKYRHVCSVLYPGDVLLLVKASRVWL